MEENSNTFSGHVLFVCSGNKNGRCTAAITEQARVFKKYGTKVSFFKVKGKGVWGYLRSAVALKHHVKLRHYDIVHAHYGLSGIAASMAGARPLIVSLMGSDIFGSFLIRWMVRFFAICVWPVTIVKSEIMARKLGIKKVYIIPNGIDFSLFKEFPRSGARSEVGFTTPRIVLWPADPARKVKNISLAKAAMNMLQCKDCELKVVYGVSTTLMPMYYNASDVVLVTSEWEGSSNVVKEALACNVPVVSTPVGDVARWLSGVEGCSICKPAPADIARAIDRTLKLDRRTHGREKIGELDNQIVVGKIFSLYMELIESGGHLRVFT
jgi:glycosyltransferase involved in cell wall biosynthesis